MYEDRAETTVIAEENVAITTKVDEIASKTEEPIIAEENVTAQIENKRIPTFEPSKKKSITAILPLLNAAGSWTDIAHAEKSKKKKKGSMGTISGLFGALSWLAIIILIAIATKNPVTAGFAAIMSLAAFLFALMAMIFGGIAIKKAKKGAGRGGAILGITLSSIYFIFLLIGLILLL